jgi:hypothetical protein
MIQICLDKKGQWKSKFILQPHTTTFSVLVIALKVGKERLTSTWHNRGIVLKKPNKLIYNGR